MTISESIIQWLYTNGTIQIDERINTEKLDGSAVAYSLSKVPQNLVNKFIDGSERRTQYYMFFVRQSTQIESERISNDKFLENLEDWVWMQNKNRNFPILDNKRTCESIGVSSTYYLYETEEEEGVYSLTIQIVYRKEI